uniref:Uncharacterized protein n=1 Tax=Daphnia magna TaxID=35525 RepID=A0A0P6BJB1_9CRUS
MSKGKGILVVRINIQLKRVAKMSSIVVVIKGSNHMKFFRSLDDIIKHIFELVSEYPRKHEEF